MISMPGSADWLLAALDLHVQLALRRLLRRLEREADARLASLWLVDIAGGSTLVEFAGDDAVVPRSLPKVAGTVPSYVEVECKDGEQHQAVVHRVRLGRRMPRMLLVVVDAHLGGQEPLELIEDFGDRVEEIVVGAIEPTGAHGRAG